MTIMCKFMVKYQFSLLCGIACCRKIQLCMEESCQKWCSKTRILSELRCSAHTLFPAYISIHLNTHRIIDWKAHSPEIFHGKVICQQFSCQFKHCHTQPDRCKNYSNSFQPFSSRMHDKLFLFRNFRLTFRIIVHRRHYFHFLLSLSQSCCVIRCLRILFILLNASLYFKIHQGKICRKAHRNTKTYRNQQPDNILPSR